MSAPNDRAKTRHGAARVFHALGRGVLVGLKWLLYVVGGLLGLVALLFVLLGSSPGLRAEVLSFALDKTNAILPGHVTVQRLDRLSPFGVELRGVTAYDPQGTEVARLGHADVDTDLAGLLTGQIALSKVMLRDVWVDLRVLEDRRGLLAAFVDPDAPSTPPKPGPPPDVTIDAIDVANVLVELPPTDPIGQATVQVHELRGSFSMLEGDLHVELQQLSAHARRDQEELLALVLSGKMLPGASTVQLDARLGEMQLVVNASGTLPTEDNWDAQPFSADVDLRGVEAQRIAHLLRDPQLKDAFLGEVALGLKAQGTPKDLTVDGALATNGGTVRFVELSARGRELRAVLATDGIQLDQVRTGLPPRRVALELRASSSGFPPDPVDLSVELRKLAVDGTPLPEIDASTRYTETALEALKLEARDGESRIRADGKLEFEGALDLGVRLDLRPDLVSRLASLVEQRIAGRVVSNVQLHREASGELLAEGTLGLQGVAVLPASNAASGSAPADAPAPTLTVEQLATEFRVQGTPPQLAGRVHATVERATQGERTLDHAELHVEGSLAAVDVTLDARGGLRPADAHGRRPSRDQAALQLRAHVERGGEHTRVVGSGSGKVTDRPLEFTLQPTVVFDSGRLETDGIELILAGQRVRIQGELAPQGKTEGLDIDLGPVDLTVLQKLGIVEQNVVGTVTGQVHVAGTTRVPVVTAKLEGRGLGLLHKPLVNLTAALGLDAAKGNAHTDITVSGRDFSGQEGVAMTLDAQLAFEPGPRFANTLTQGEIELALKVARLESEFLKEYLPKGALPVNARAQTSIDVRGTLAALTLAADTTLTVRVAGKKPVLVHNVLGYQAGKLDTQLAVSDGRGPWLESTARIQLPLPEPSAHQLGAAFSQAATQATWELQLDTKKRSLGELDLLSLLVDTKTLPPVAFATEFAARHEPGQEPELDFSAAIDQAGTLDQEQCSTRRLTLEVQATHRGSDNELSVVGAAGAQRLLTLQARAPLALAPVLAGQKPEVGAIDFDLESESLQLGSVPFLCGQAHGTVSARALGRDLLGANPRAELEVRAVDFGLAKRQGINLQLLAEASGEQLTAELDLQGAGEYRAALGRIDAKLPWSFAQGKVELAKDAPLWAEIELKTLPLAPFVPPDGPVAYVRGTVDAAVRVGGKLNAPQLNGDLRLHDVAFTSTALAQPLRGVQGHLRMDGRKVHIEHFEARDQDGVVRLKGHVDVTQMEQVETRIEIDAKKFPLRQRGQVVAVTDLKAVAKATVAPQNTSVELVFQDVDTWLESLNIRKGIALDAHPEFVIDGDPAKGSQLADDARAERKASRNKPGETTAQDDPKADAKKAAAAAKEADAAAQAEDAQNQVITIVIDAEERFWIKRNDFAVKLTTVLKTRVEDSVVRVNGDVTIDRGYLQLFGKVFDLSRESKLRFVGSNPPNPVLELEAENKTRGGSIVTVRITGRGDAPVLQFLVDGEEVDAGIAVAELFGGEKGGGETDASSQAQSFVAGLTAGVLATAARRELGAAAPILMIDPAEKAGEGRVRAGFELDDLVPKFLRPIITGVYLEGIVARESEGETSSTNTQFGALLEFYFPKNFFTAGQYGPGTTWSLDVGWQL